jgi:hypothetical protein
MRGAWSVTAVLALAAAITMFQASGVAAFFPDDGSYQTDDALEEQAGTLDPNREGISGTTNEQEGSIVGLIVGGSQLIFSFIGSVVLLPFDLHRLGLWWWAAYPIGLLLQIHGSIAGIQFVTQRVLD